MPLVDLIIINFCLRKANHFLYFLRIYVRLQRKKDHCVIFPLSQHGGNLQMYLYSWVCISNTKL